MLGCEVMPVARARDPTPFPSAPMTSLGKCVGGCRIVLTHQNSKAAHPVTRRTAFSYQPLAIELPEKVTASPCDYWIVQYADVFKFDRHITANVDRWGCSGSSGPDHVTWV